MSTDISLAKLHVWMVVGVALAFFVLQHADTFRVPKGFFVLAWKAQEIEATH